MINNFYWLIIISLMSQNWFYILRVSYSGVKSSQSDITCQCSLWKLLFHNLINNLNINIHLTEYTLHKTVDILWLDNSDCFQPVLAERNSKKKPAESLFSILARMLPGAFLCPDLCRKTKIKRRHRSGHRMAGVSKFTNLQFAMCEVWWFNFISVRVHLNSHANSSFHLENSKI